MNWKDMSAKVNVRWNVQYKNGNEIAGYVIYAWIAHPLLAEILNTRQYADTEYQAKKIAREMRLRFKPLYGLHLDEVK